MAELTVREVEPAIVTPVLFTVDDLEKMIDLGIFVGRTGRIELIDGELQSMSPASNDHDILVRKLSMWSVRQQNEELFEVGVQMGMRLRETESMPEPDLFWVAAGHTCRPTTEVVPLVIEVSLSSIDYDRDIKGRLYALDGLNEYWIVDVERQCIEIYRLPRGGRFTDVQVFDRSRTIYPLCLPTASLDINWLFRSVGPGP